MWDDMCVGNTAACVDVYKGRGPLGHNPKGYGVHRQPRLPDCTMHGCPPLMLSVFPLDFGSMPQYTEKVDK